MKKISPKIDDEEHKDEGYKPTPQLKECTETCDVERNLHCYDVPYGVEDEFE